MLSLEPYYLGWPAAEWRIPAHVDLHPEGDHLVYSHHTPGAHVSDRDQRSPKLVASFIDLAAAPPESILTFARTWGPLDLCDHDLPKWHIPPLLYPSNVPLGTSPYPCPWVRTVTDSGLPWHEPGWYAKIESLALWRLYAGRAKALLQMVEDIKQGRRPRDVVIRFAAHRVLGYGISAKTLSRFSIDMLRETVVKILNQWIADAGIMPHMYLDQKRFAMTIGGRHLLAAVALQLASAACDSRATIICAHCQRPYIPTRRPSPQTHHYCSDCRQKNFDGIERQRRYRQRHSRRT